MAKRILVVDDEPELLMAIEIRLKMSGYETMAAHDGQEGLERARKDKPDLIILDLMLPKIDGYKVCALLKADARYSNIPIIMLTARAQDTDEKLGLEVGANAFITKPFQHEAVLAKIKELLGE
jgi:DNA-binding response OmpR family regulator